MLPRKDVAQFLVGAEFEQNGCFQFCNLIQRLATSRSRFRVRSQNEQEIWNECSRLIANAVVHYNAMLLSEMVKMFEKQRDTESLKNLERISPLAWQHINFYGRYQFDREIEPLNMAAMAAHISDSGVLPWRKQG